MGSEKEIHLINNKLRWSDFGAVEFSTDALATESYVGSFTVGSVAVASSTAPDDIKAQSLYVCTGTNDDVVINQAITDGGQDVAVRLSQGVFNISAPILINLGGTSLTGTGVGQRAGVSQSANGSMLYAAADFSGDAVVLVKDDGITHPVYGVTLRDFSVDFNAAVSSGDAVYFSSNRGTIDHVHVFNAPDDGFRLHGVNGWDTYDSTLLNCQASRCGNAGIHFDTDAPDCHAVLCVLFDNAYGFLIHSASEQITNCHTYNNSINNFYFDNSGSRTKVVNCKIEGAGQHGVLLDSLEDNGTSDVLFVGNNFKNSGDSADNTYDHVHIVGLTGAGHTRSIFNSNNFSYQESASPNKPRYGINLTGGVAQGTTIVGNAFGPATHWGTAPIVDNSSDANPAFIRNNKGWLDKHSVIYVRDYLAKNTGFDDATAFIQEAIDAAPEGGATIQFDEGVYELTAPLVIRNDGILLQGAGFGNRMGGTQDGWGTRIKPDALFVGTELVRWERLADDRTLFGGGALRMNFDANLLAGVSCVVAKVESATFRDVGFHQSAGDALTISGYASWKAEFNSIINCLFTEGLDSAIVLSTDSRDCLIQGSTFFSFDDSAIQVAASDHRIIGNVIREMTINGIHFNNSGNRTKVIGNVISDIGHEAILLDNSTIGFSDIVISGNEFLNCGITNANTYDSIMFGTTSQAISRVAINGNNFLNSATNKPRYGVNYVGSGSQHNVLTGNTFGPSTHWGTGPVNDNSSATAPSIIGNNVGYLRSRRQLAKASDYTAIQMDEVITVTAGASNKTITLPTAVGAAYREMTIFRMDGAAGNVIVDGNASETINGATTKTLGTQYSSITIAPVSGNWIIVSQTGTVT